MNLSPFYMLYPEFARLYGEGQSMNRIADTFGCSTHSVRKGLRRLGVDTSWGTVEERFFKKVDRSRDAEGVWLWTGSISGSGYGSFYDGTRNLTAHAYAWELYNGEPTPEGMEIRHLDGDRLNVHPDNLRPGTKKENADDKRRHGTVARGEQNGGGGKLSADDVREIRRAYAAGEGTQTAIGKRFGVTGVMVGHITRGKIWKHV